MARSPPQSEPKKVLASLLFIPPTTGIEDFIEIVFYFSKNIENNCSRWWEFYSQLELDNLGLPRFVSCFFWWSCWNPLPSSVKDTPQSCRTDLLFLHCRQAIKGTMLCLNIAFFPGLRTIPFSLSKAGRATLLRDKFIASLATVGAGLISGIIIFFVYYVLLTWFGLSFCFIIIV